MLALASTSVTVAVIPNPLETGLVLFRRRRIPKGVYAVLGSSGSETYCFACAKNMPLVSMRSHNSILSIIYGGGSSCAPLQGLYQILRNGRSPELGAVTQCPHSK